MIVHQTGQYSFDVAKDPLDLTIIQLAGESIAVTVNMLEPDSKAEVRAITIGQNDDQATLTVKLHHRSTDTTANFTGRALMSDNSQLLFNGLIEIEEGAKNTESYLTHRSLLQDQARVNPNPALEISNNAVKASHSASVTQLDDSAILFLTSRGLNKEDARKLLTEAFLTDITEKLDESWQRKIEDIIR